MHPDLTSGSPDGRPRRTDPRSSSRPVAVLVVVAALVVLVGGATACGTSGRTLRDPAPGATAPPRKTSTTIAPPAFDTTPVAGLSISSTAWSPAGEIPRGYTCDGEDASPPLVVAGAPEGTVELVLVVTDQDAAGYVHWVVASIPPGEPSFPQGGVPAGAVEAPNSAGQAAWSGPCPPAGAAHTYDFTIYALAAASGLGPASTADEITAVTAQATTVAAMTGTYTRA